MFQTDCLPYDKHVENKQILVILYAILYLSGLILSKCNKVIFKLRFAECKLF